MQNKWGICQYIGAVTDIQGKEDGAGVIGTLGDTRGFGNLVRLRGFVGIFLSLKFCGGFIDSYLI